ncbi:MAG: ABC transporter substrate-binding protein [Actinobacteria bacterium]|nr:ABC transporter substrate-binding protein [Actinomycetota bacterium]
MHLAEPFRRLEVERRRLHGPALGEGDERRAHRLPGLLERDEAPHLRLVQDQDLHRVHYGRGSMRRMTRTMLPTCLALTTSLAACGTEGPEETGSVKIAFIEDLSGPDALEHVLPARRSVELALQIAEITSAADATAELVPLDIASAPDAVDEVVDDPAFVAVIVAPGAPSGASLASRGLPTISLSGLGGGPPQDAAWLRSVGSFDAVAEAIADRVPSSTTCVLSDDGSSGDLGELVGERLGTAPSTIEPPDARGIVGRSGCTTVVWVGGPNAGAETLLTLEGSGVAFTGGDGLLGPDFLEVAGPAADGVTSMCACADVSTSLELDVQRFIQDYQAEFGAPPGGYAVEAWDAANLLLRALREGGRSRDAVHRFLASVTETSGLAQTYRFGPDGELADPDSSVVTYFALGGRWSVDETEEPAG